MMNIELDIRRVLEENGPLTGSELSENFLIITILRFGVNVMDQIGYGFQIVHGIICGMIFCGGTNFVSRRLSFEIFSRSALFISQIRWLKLLKLEQGLRINFVPIV